MNKAMYKVLWRKSSGTCRVCLVPLVEKTPFYLLNSETAIYLGCIHFIAALYIWSCGLCRQWSVSCKLYSRDKNLHFINNMFSKWTATKIYWKLAFLLVTLVPLASFCPWFYFSFNAGRLVVKDWRKIFSRLSNFSRILLFSIVLIKKA